MTEPKTLHDVILELGLEDWIPLPEVRATAEKRGLLPPEESARELSVAMVALLKEGRIQVWSGPWPDEPKPVPALLAETILLDDRRYSFESEADGMDRVYYVNVDNIRA